MVTLDIAGIPVRMENRFPYFDHISREYRTDREPLYTFCATDEEMRNEASYPHDLRLLPYLESAVFHRKTAEVMPMHGGVFCHGAVIVANGGAYLFTAKSGTGKTTHVNLWKKVYGDSVFVLNGDKPVLRFSDGTLYASGTPWRGKEEYGTPGAYPLRGIVFLNRGEENSIVRVPTDEGLLQLANFVYLPNAKPSASATLALCGRILSQTPLYRLSCNMEDGAAVTAYQAIIQ